MPLMETRFLLHRLETPFAGMPHVDMLHTARRLWRSHDDNRDEDARGLVTMAARTADCRLTTLEGTLCGHRREGDVPGFEIPSRYFHYVRSSDARALESVLEHNRLDLLALALVTAHASQLLEDGPAAARTAREALGMGRLYERAGLVAEARAAFDRAATMPVADPVTRAEALRAYAVLSRRHRRYEEAAVAWRRLLELPAAPPTLSREATEALAVHHEHRLRDPFAARTFALQSMSMHQSPSRREAVQHRLARLDRKLAEIPRDVIPLF
jgi:tetratricopeptide (TPR) repeat protein